MIKWLIILLILLLLAGCYMETVTVNEDEHKHSYVEFNGKCPICQKEGKISRVYKQGCMSTLMATYAYYDENGEYHFEDPNTTTCGYKCSEGHSFIVDNGRIRVEK